MNSTPRLYIPEGVYSFDSYYIISKTSRDKFGEPITNTRKVYYGSGEVSFRSDRLVIILNGKKEVINLAKPYIYDWQLSINHITYNFPIINWKAGFENSDVNFFTFDSIENKYSRTHKLTPDEFFKEPAVSLNIESRDINGVKSNYSYIEIYSAAAYKRPLSDKPVEIKSIRLIGLGKPREEPIIEEKPSGIENNDFSSDDLKVFKIVPNGEYKNQIRMDNLKYKYDTYSGVPDYATEAKVQFYQKH
jgi:hypothetical protein